MISFLVHFVNVLEYFLKVRLHLVDLFIHLHRVLVDLFVNVLAELGKLRPHLVNPGVLLVVRGLDECFDRLDEATPFVWVIADGFLIVAIGENAVWKVHSKEMLYLIIFSVQIGLMHIIQSYLNRLDMLVPLGNLRQQEVKHDYEVEELV